MAVVLYPGPGPMYQGSAVGTVVAVVNSKDELTAGYLSKQLPTTPTVDDRKEELNFERSGR